MPCVCHLCVPGVTCAYGQRMSTNGNERQIPYTSGQPLLLTVETPYCSSVGERKEKSWHARLTHTRTGRPRCSVLTSARASARARARGVAYTPAAWRCVFFRIYGGINAAGADSSARTCAGLVPGFVPGNGSAGQLLALRPDDAFIPFYPNKGKGGQHSTEKAGQQPGS